MLLRSPPTVKNFSLPRPTTTQSPSLTSPGGQPAGRVEVGLRCLLAAQVADHHAAQVMCRLDHRHARAGRLETGDGLGAVRRGQVVDGALVQHDQPVREFERALGLRIDVDVAIEIGAGQHHGQRIAWPLGRPALDRFGGTARVQRHHRVGRLAMPAVHQFNSIMGSQHLRPPPGGLPVAVVGSGERGCRDADQGAKHAHGYTGTRSGITA